MTKTVRLAKGQWLTEEFAKPKQGRVKAVYYSVGFYKHTYIHANIHMERLYV